MKCMRCGKETSIHIMSMFNTDEICLDCSDKEEKDPRYNLAKEAELAACRSGNFNFKGIGW